MGYAPGMAEQYGMPGETDDEGFDPYKDTVGPGIYGGIVKRDPETGEVVIGRQYQDHNPRPGPVYAGGGYTPTTKAVHAGEPALKKLLDKYPHLVNDVSTGGATRFTCAACHAGVRPRLPSSQTSRAQTSKLWIRTDIAPCTGWPRIISRKERRPFSRRAPT